MAAGESILRPINLTSKHRNEIFDKSARLVSKEYFDPKFNGTDWPKLAAESRDRIISIEEPEAFELAMHDLVRSLKTSHTGFFHESVKRVPGRLAVGANFRRVETELGAEWILQDLHEGGPGHAAGLKPLDRLQTIAGKRIAPPDQPMFPMGSTVAITVLRAGAELELTVAIPSPRSRKQPYAEPKAVTSSIIPEGIGYLKVSILPGLLGLNVAREIDAALVSLANCDRLIIELRGHLGGGLGVLRLMSHLTPEKLPIGFTVTRKLAEKGYDKSNLHRLDRLPTNLPNPLAIASMAIQYGMRDPSLLLVSEGLGPHRWHGRVALLVNEHTVSAGEMVAAFASENGLAKIVGTETAGRLIPGSGSKVGQGYMLIMPKAEYVTWKGCRFEGRGVKPDVEVPWSIEGLVNGRDDQLRAAVSLLTGKPDSIPEKSSRVQ
jgi:carboxyl-terminal processing protease